MTTQERSTGVDTELPVDRLKAEALELGKALAHRGVMRVGHGVEDLTHRLNDVAHGADGIDVRSNLGKAATPLKSGAQVTAQGVQGAAGRAKDTLGHAVGGLRPGRRHRTGKKSTGAKDQGPKVTNIVESVEVPVSRDVAYREWTRFEEFPTFMKKVEAIKQEKDEVVTWKAQVFLSHGRGRRPSSTSCPRSGSSGSPRPTRVASTAPSRSTSWRPT